MKSLANLRRYCDVFWKQGWIIVLVVVLAVGGALYRLGGQPPQYQAEASILVTPEGIAPAALTDARLIAIQSLYRDTMLNDIVHLLRSRTISERAAEQVGGLNVPEIARRVTVRKIAGTDFILVQARDAQPEGAALIANAMAQQLVDFYAQMHRVGATRSRMFIEEQLRLARDRRAAAQQAALEFQVRTGAVALPDEASRTAQRLLDLQAAYEAARLDETTAQTRVAAIRSHLTAQKDGQLASLSIATNPVVTQIRDHLTGLELQLADLRQVYTNQHPAVKALVGKIAADQERMSAEAAKVLNDKSLGMSPAREQFVREMIDGEVDAAAAGARATEIRTLLGKLQARLSSVPDDALALARLQQNARDAEQLVTGLAALQPEAVVRESQAVASGQSAIVVVDEAVAPSRPVAPPVPQTAALAGLLGLCLGAALALAVESVATRIRTSRRPEAAGVVLEPATVPPIRAFARAGALAAALGMAVVLVPVLLMALVLSVVLMAGAVAGVPATASGAQAGGVPAHLSYIGQTLTQAVQGLHGMYLQQMRALPDHVAHISEALMRAFSAVQ